MKSKTRKSEAGSYLLKLQDQLFQIAVTDRLLAKI